MKVILDLVVNHTSDEHTWFQAALADSTSKYRQYYIFKPGVDGHAPNNWRSLFGGSAWEKVPNEDQYYLHVFHKKQPDLNWENPKMRADIYQMINRWLARGIAGFRIDSITFIKKDQDFDSLPADGADGLVSVAKKARNRPGIAAMLTELHQQTFDKFNCVSIGEAPGVAYDEYQQYIGPQGYFSMIFDFHYVDIDVESGSEWWRRTNWTPTEFKQLLFKSQMSIQEVGWGANFLENHDQPRSLSKLITDTHYQNAIGAKALAILLMTLRGTPFIYQGEELGMLNAQRPSITDFNDISSVDNYQRAQQQGYSPSAALSFVNLRSRDNTRTPYPWNAETYGGFSQKTPWLAMDGHQATINHAQQVADRASVLNFYQRLIQLRQHSAYQDTLVDGTFAANQQVPANVIGFTRTGKQQLQILINLSSNNESVSVEGTPTVLINNYADVDCHGSQLVLKPYQAIIFEGQV